MSCAKATAPSSPVLLELAFVAHGRGSCCEQRPPEFNSSKLLSSSLATGVSRLLVSEGPTGEESFFSSSSLELKDAVALWSGDVGVRYSADGDTRCSSSTSANNGLSSSSATIVLVSRRWPREGRFMLRTSSSRRRERSRRTCRTGD